MTGKLFGVGLGPGDPDLITIKAARLIAGADVIAYHSGPSGNSIARSIAAEMIPADIPEIAMVYPVTTGTTDHPGGYAGAMTDFYDEQAVRIAEHLAAGKTVVVLCEGDPLFYGSYMYVHDRLSGLYSAEVVPGVTSVSAAAAATGIPLVRHEDVLTILPGTLPKAELARRLADTQGAAIMKLGRTFPAVREALQESGAIDRAWYVERASSDRQRMVPVKDVDPAAVPYFSIVIVPTVGDPVPLTPATDGRPTADVVADRPNLVVLGIGPGENHWVTPEVTAALDAVDHIVGYAPYLDRIPQRVGLQRHASGNTVEVDRARFALELAQSGEKVAVVSGGDAGVFGMASAVFEAADGGEFDDVDITVLPAMTAVQAVAARAGAPIGGDFAVMSLSDRLKPWSLIEERLAAVASADLVLAIYNPASRSRTTQVAEAKAVLLQHRSGSVPVVVGRDVGRPAERLEVTTLADFDPATIDMKCLLIIGSSGTRVSSSGKVWTSRSTPVDAVVGDANAVPVVTSDHLSQERSN